MNTRRNFIKAIGGITAGLASINHIATAAPARPAKAKYMGGFIAPKLETIKVAVIGLGARGNTHYPQLAAFEGTEIVALCDLYEDLCTNAKNRVNRENPDRHKNIKLYHGDKHAYKKMLEETKPDLVYVVTPWEWHAPMAIDAMNAGAHVCVEVPLATTLEECWKIVDTSEKTQKHCMMLENVNYGRDELMFLNMCRKGVFGELVHGEAAYIHELRGQMGSVDAGRGTGSWRTYHWAKKAGNLYPTHGLGPVAQYMNIGRGEDTFRRIVSFSSPPRNHELWVEKNAGKDSKLKDIEFVGGDMSTSIIKTQIGRTIMVQWDESSPRPYTRHNLIQGTKGTGAGFPTRVAIEHQKGELPEKVANSLKSYHSWTQGADLNALYEEYDHPLYLRLKEIGQKMGGHGGMDAMMNYRVVECLQTGQPLDQNVYEGCLWSAVTPLSIQSVKEDGMPQDFPDFTRGEWKNTAPLPVVS